MARSERSLAQLRAIMLSYQRRGLVGPGGYPAKTFSRVFEGRRRLAQELRQMRRNPEPDILHYQAGDRSWRQLALDKVNRMRRSRGKAPIIPGPDTARLAGPSNVTFEGNQKAWRFLDTSFSHRPNFEYQAARAGYGQRRTRGQARETLRGTQLPLRFPVLEDGQWRWDFGVDGMRPPPPSNPRSWFRYPTTVGRRPVSLTGHQLEFDLPKYEFDESGQLGFRLKHENAINGTADARSDLRQQLNSKYRKRDYHLKEFSKKITPPPVYKRVRHMAWGRPYWNDVPVKQSLKPDFPEWQTKPGKVWKRYPYRYHKDPPPQPVQQELFGDIDRLPRFRRRPEPKEPFWDSRQRQFQFGEAASELGVPSHIIPRSKAHPPQQLSLNLRKKVRKPSGSQYKKERLKDFKAGLQDYHVNQNVMPDTPRGSRRRIEAAQRIREFRRTIGGKKVREQLKYYGRRLRRRSNPDLLERRVTW